MEFELSLDQKGLSKDFEEFSRRFLAPIASECDENQEFIPWDIWKRMASLGYCGLPISREFGGAGLGALDTCICMEAAGRGGAAAGHLLSWAVSMCLASIPIMKFGTREQKEHYLPEIARGELICSFCLTEPDAGSDAGGMRTRAVRDGNYYVLNGSKAFITNGPIGDLFLVFAVTDPDKGPKGISAFLIEKDFPGFKRGKKLDKMGMRSSPTGDLIFNDCLVPAANLLGAEGDGFKKIAHRTLEWERANFSFFIGVMEYNLRQSIQYARERIQFKRPISDFQAVRHMLAEMKIELDAARLMYYRIAWMIDKNLVPAPVEASSAKIFLARAMKKNADYAVQIHGANGMMKEYSVERSLRDYKLLEIGGGTAQIQLDIIARELLGTGR
ncbi:MAG: acyl-CoA dehydrogenase family protein [Chitinophagales bacterium]